MDSFLVKFNEYTKNKFSYLRLKKVEFFEYQKVAKIYLMIPEDIYENGFDNNLIKELNAFTKKIAGGYKCQFFFEKLIVTEEIVKYHILDLLATEYPFLAVSINADCIQIDITSKINVEIKIEEDVYTLIKGAAFVSKIIDNLEENFGIESFITFTLVPTGEIKIDHTENKIVSRNTVPILEIKYLCGIDTKAISQPIFIDSINKAYEKVCIVGVVKQNDKRIFEKDPNSNYKYFKNNYLIKINDFSGDFTCYFKTNDDNCPLQSVVAGDQIMLQGKIAYSERKGSFVMYAKTIFTAKMDRDKVVEMLRPKPVPDSLKYPARKYEGQDFLVKQTLFDLGDDNKFADMNCVFFAYRNNGKNFSPYEICLLSFTNGKPDLVYETYVKVSNTERIDIEDRPKVSQSKRFAEYVQDILCFTKNKTIYCKKTDDVLKEISEIAKVQHVECNLDLLDADKIGAKNGQKFEPTLERMLKEHSIALKSNRSYDVAIAMAQLFMKVKK